MRQGEERCGELNTAFFLNLAVDIVRKNVVVIEDAQSHTKKAFSR